MIIFIICSTLNSIFILLICLMWFCWVFSSYILVILKRVHASGMLERISFDSFCIIHRKGATRILRGGCQVRFKGIFNLQSANACCGIRRFFGVATCTTRNICQMRLLPLNTPKQFGDRFLRYQIFSKGEFFDIFSHGVCVSRVIAGIMLEFRIVSGVSPLPNVAIGVPHAAASRFASDGAY